MYGLVRAASRLEAVPRAILILMVLLSTHPTAGAQSYRFLSLPSAQAGYGTYPSGALVRDPMGNIYGTTSDGSADYIGAVVEITAAGNPKTLHTFRTGGGDGLSPLGTLLLNHSGNIYGTTELGGANSGGTVFKIDRQGNETVMYSFKGGADGFYPTAGLIQDGAGNLYGTTEYGGSGNNGSCSFTCGTVFLIDASGSETVLYAFKGSPDGANPGASLIRDSSGNFYGTTVAGGTGTNCKDTGGCGTVFKVDPQGNEAILYSFQGGADGSFPVSNLIFDSAGNLYGTTSGQGDGDPGTIFKLDTSGNETVVYRFTGGSDGSNPYGGLVMDQLGSLYGTAFAGGEDPCFDSFFFNGCGTVFEVDQAGNETTLYTFDEIHGAHPTAGLLREASGVLYGTTAEGGSGNCLSDNVPVGCGVVFRLVP